MEIWSFRTANFLVLVTAETEYDVDLSWDDTGGVCQKLDSGDLEVFCAKCAVYLNGCEIASDYLGNCIYESAHDFRDHVGINEKSRADGANYGSYFSDMVRAAISEAREHMKKNQAVYIR